MANKLIGKNPEQVPTNNMLGSMAFQSREAVSVGGIYTDAGTAALPSHAFSADRASGIWQPATSAIAVSTAGSERMRIDSSGNIGVGTSFPADKLQVEGNLYFGTSNRVVYSGGAANLTLQTSTGVLAFNTGGSVERMRITNSGYVSIGSTTPGSSKLYVYDANVSITTNEVAAAGTGVASNRWKYSTNHYGIYVGSVNAMVFYDYGASAERMRIDSSGNLLVGTTSAGAKLTVGSGSIQLDNTFGVNFKDNAGTAESVISLSSANNLSIASPTLSGSIQYAVRSATGSHQFITGGSERMRIDSSGNLGIGTTSPQRPLHVAYLSSNVGAYTAIFQGQTGGYGAGVSFQSQLTGGSLAEMGRITADGESSWNTTASTQYAGLRFYTATEGTVSEKMRINGYGDIQIGTTLGYGRLTVAESVASGDTNISIYNSAGAAVSGVQGTKISFLNDSGFSEGNPAAYIQTRSNDGGGSGQTSMRFGVYNGSAVAEAMRITSAGNLGVGTTGPIGKLQVSSSGGGLIVDYLGDNYYNAGAHYFRNAASTATVYLAPGTSSSILSTNAAVPLAFGTNSSERMRITSAGNVGIGTSSPARPLDVNGTVRLSDGAAVEWGGVSAYISGTSASNALLFATSSAEAMRITSAGNVGIGTNAPGAKLHVDTTSIPFKTSGPGSGSILQDIYITRTSSGTTIQSGPNITFEDGTTNNSVTIQNSQGNLTFWNYGGGAWAERMRITSAGNVGIGTSSPTPYKLNVNKGAQGQVAQFTDGIESTFAIKTASGLLSVGQANNFPLALLTNDTERMRIDTSGNVGIGTSTPSSYGKLAVLGNIAATTDGATILTMRANAGATNLGSYNATGSYLAFQTNASGSGEVERMRIDSSGNLLVGTTTQQGRITVNQQSTEDVIRANLGSSGSALNVVSSATTANAAYFFTSSGVAGSITLSGTATAYNTSSDARLKHDIVNAPEASALIDAIKVRSFKWNADNSEQRYGMVAQELLEVAPEAVSVPADEEAMMGVDYSKLVPMLIKEVQSLRARVAQLEGK